MCVLARESGAGGQQQRLGLVSGGPQALKGSGEVGFKRRKQVWSVLEVPRPSSAHSRSRVRTGVMGSWVGGSVERRVYRLMCVFCLQNFTAVYKFINF